MSWARDEWKLDLPTTALRKISELENDAESLRKSKQQQQFQLESLSSALQKQKQLNAEEKALNSNLRREIQEWTRKCSDFECQEEKTLVDFRAKDNKIGLLEEQLRKAKAKLKDEEDKNSELLSQIDHQKLIAEAKENEIGELSEELERAKDAKAQLVKDLEGMFLQFSSVKLSKDISLQILLTIISTVLIEQLEDVMQIIKITFYTIFDWFLFSHNLFV